VAEIVKLFGEALRAQDTNHKFERAYGASVKEEVKILEIG
jgi:hypothetical protein